MSEPMEAFRNAFRIPELKSRILFTLGMLAVFRLGSHVPSPGVDGNALAMRMGDSGLMSFYDMFTGGAFQYATVFALGIMPYITASIIFSLLIPVIPALEALQKSGSEGQKKITEWTGMPPFYFAWFSLLGTRSISKIWARKSYRIPEYGLSSCV